MMNRRETLLASVLLVSGAVMSTAEAQAPADTPPSTVGTRLGQLKYEVGTPSLLTCLPVSRRA
jgi:hypothetical protein